MSQENQNSFQFMMDACEEINRTSDAMTAFYRGKRFVRDITGGVEHSTQDRGNYGLVQCISNPDPDLKSFRLNTMPKTMLEQRWQVDAFSFDPVVNMAARITTEFTWDQANAVADKRSQRVSAICKEHTGQGNGIAWPIVSMGMRRGCISIGFDISPDEFSPEQIMMMRYVSECAYRRVDALLGPFAADDVGEPLSPRELDVLKRIANGMTTAQAAGDIGITPETALDYLRRAKRKTGTQRTPHTVKVALTQGLMLP